MGRNMRRRRRRRTSKQLAVIVGTTRVEKERFVTMTAPERVFVTNQIFDYLCPVIKLLLLGAIPRARAMTVLMPFPVRVGEACKIYGNARKLGRKEPVDINST
jgi:hypothetical protein